MADPAQDEVRGAKSERSIVKHEFGDAISNLQGCRTIDLSIPDVLGTNLLQPWVCGTAATTRIGLLFESSIAHSALRWDNSLALGRVLVQIGSILQSFLVAGTILPAN